MNGFCQSNNQSTTHHLMSVEQGTATESSTVEDGSTEDLLAIEKICMSCPNCKHEFKLIDGLLLDDQTAQQQSQLLKHQQQSCNASRLSPVTRSDTCSSTTRLTMATETQASAMTRATDFGFCEEPAPAQVSQTFQIVNRTIDQLERLICDSYDRRIRKISSISQCDIEIRSELPSRKFGAAKNYCIVRAISPCRIEKCRSLLRLQMGWVLLPKA